MADGVAQRIHGIMGQAGYFTQHDNFVRQQSSSASIYS